jgi:hypothetical protein
MTMWPDKSRGCVKTVMSKYGNDQFCDMRYVVEMSRRIQWSKNEFSHSLPPEPTPIVLSVPHSRLTVPAARLSFGLGGYEHQIARNYLSWGRTRHWHRAGRTYANSRDRRRCAQSIHAAISHPAWFSRACPGAIWYSPCMALGISRRHFVARWVGAVYFC